MDMIGEECGVAARTTNAGVVLPRLFLKLKFKIK